ncbi:MAG: acetoin utilization protein AcuC [Bacillota bacterium]|nr:acetoin utilization protein AcuC [Bacillota bacterium]
MSGKAVCIYSPEFLRYRFSDTHPFNPLRLELTLDLAREAGVLKPEELLPPRSPAPEEDLALVHDRSYLEAVKRAGHTGRVDGEATLFGLGTDDNPIFPYMHEAAALIVGGTWTAAELVATGQCQHAFNPAGGLHHAHRARAAGFCIYNDAAVAIARLQRDYGLRAVYLDLDAHHGDGVQEAFYDDPGVLTISFHETGRYLFPGTGEVEERGRNAGYGYAFNVPLEAFTEDDSWLECFTAVVPPLVRDFAPDIIFSQHGCDAHRFDDLSHLCATTRLYQETARLIHALAHEVAGGRWVALGGGGYDIWRVVPRAWTLVWAELAERPLPEQIPATWRARWQPRSPFPLPEYFLDPPDAFPPVPRRAEIAEKNRLTVRRLLGDFYWPLSGQA